MFICNVMNVLVSLVYVSLHEDYIYFQGNDFSEAQEGDPKYLAPELMDGKYSKAADIFRYVANNRYCKKDK